MEVINVALNFKNVSVNLPQIILRCKMLESYTEGFLKLRDERTSLIVATANI